MSTRLLLIHALSPVHAGTGQSVGAIDLAIARDRATDHPYIPGSSLKGTLRAESQEQLGKEETVAIFGPETENASDHAGAVAFGDANLLLLPIRSVAGTFAWVTSPFLLARFARDAVEAGLTPPAAAAITLLQECRLCGSESRLKLSVGKQERVVFEDLDLQPTAISAKPWADFLGGLIFPGDPTWQAFLTERLCIVHDDMMTYLSRYGSDVVARIAMDPDSKTVRKGGLWYEENLPAETVLSSLVFARPNARTRRTTGQLYTSLETLTSRSVQLGGNATVGRGRCRAVWSKGK